MDKFKKLTLIGIPKNQKEHFEVVLSSYDVVLSHNFVNYIDEIDSSTDIIIYAPLGIDEGQVKKDLTSLRNRCPKTPIILGMHDKSFNVLLQGFYFNIKNIIFAPFEEVDIKQALVKSAILKEVSEKLPVMELLNLFSKPIKDSNILSVYERLSEYFKLFEKVNDFCVYNFTQNRMHLVFGKKAQEEMSLLSAFNVAMGDKVSVGKLHLNESNNLVQIYFPLYLDEKNSVWGVISSKDKDVDFIFNKYFLNFIEGTSNYHYSLRRMDDLVKLANTDEVTGLYNQRKLSEDLEETIKSHEKDHRKFSIMFIDVDHFKIVNDNFGHIVGSDMLYQMGKAIKATLRGSDYVYRFGGDEFVVIMPNVDIVTVHAIAVRVFDTIKNMEFIIDEQNKHKVTVSIGISEYPTDAKSAKDIIQFADEMMYQSKKSGRGKIFHVSEIINKK